MSWGDHDQDEIRKRLGTDKRKEESPKQMSGARGNSKWRRYRFKTKSVDDYRPIVFNPKYPWWCSGYDGDMSCAVIIAFLPMSEDLKTYWDDAFDIEFTDHSSIQFSDRFPMPAYYPQ